MKMTFANPAHARQDIGAINTAGHAIKANGDVFLFSGSVNGARLLMSSGNISTGNFRWYGVK